MTLSGGPTRAKVMTRGNGWTVHNFENGDGVRSVRVGEDGMLHLKFSDGSKLVLPRITDNI